MIFNSCEGDTTLKEAASPEEFAAELREIDAWNRAHGASPDLPDYISDDSSGEIHPPGSWCLAATRDKVIKGLNDLHFSFGIQMLQT